MIIRSDGRAHEHMRPIHFECGIQKFASGSVLVSYGHTRVICAATIEEKVPQWLVGRQQGWLTAEYSMLPAATHQRTLREKTMNNGRTHEIQRLIGRSLRAVCNLKHLGERTLTIDCDVLQADGGTRTAAISGAYVAAMLALKPLLQKRVIKTNPLLEPISAVSVGVVDEQVYVDLCYEEDHRAQVDCNIVMTASARLVEVQSTAEKQPFAVETMVNMLRLAQPACLEIIKLQQSVLDANV